MNNFKRILLVDDDENDIELILEAFSEINLTKNIDVAMTGMETIDYLYGRGKFKGRINGNPVLILLDIKMPQMSGLELLKKIKSIANLKTIPVVMLTSSKEESDIIESYDLGVNGYVSKPIRSKEIINTINAIGNFWIKTNEPPPKRSDDKLK